MSQQEPANADDDEQTAGKHGHLIKLREEEVEALANGRTLSLQTENNLYILGTGFEPEAVSAGVDAEVTIDPTTARREL